jgi:hypothetical protein
MKKTSEAVDDDPLDREFDFSKSRPNPYWLGVVDRKCVRLLDKELAEIFPDNSAVNEALRSLVRASKEIVPKRISAKTATAPGVRKKKGRS